MSQATTWNARSQASPFLHSPVVLAWLAVSLLLSVQWLFGYSPQGDVDDLLKAHEIRLLLDSGDIFNRTIPGILQPEPFVSHWPWIVDLPYAALTLVLRPLFGDQAALSASFFIVPLLLLAPALIMLRKITETLDFRNPGLVFAVAAVVALGALAEFEPGRIDYHNIQMLLLMLMVWLTILPGRRAALAGGVTAAAALAIGLELALFVLLSLAIRAFDFVAGGPDAGRRLQVFGLGLAASALLMFMIVVAPYDYVRPLCDRYSSPFAFSLVAAGVSFALVPAILSNARPATRTLGLLTCAVLSAGVLATSFPQCLDGPYAALSDYLQRHYLDRIGQEASLFGRSDVVLSAQMIAIAVPLTGAVAALVAAAMARLRDRAWTVYALFALLAVAHAVLYFRYLRFMPLLAGPGLVFALQCILPETIARRYAGKISLPSFCALPLLPGLALVAALVGYQFIHATRADALEGVDFAGSCDLKDFDQFQWPAGSRILAPPLVGMNLLGQPGATVTAIPFHPGPVGIERALRFFDPATADPRGLAEQAQATHVAVCAWRGERLTDIEREFPFAAGLIEGNPPDWLTACPQAPDSVLRIFRFASGRAASLACPSEGAKSEAGSDAQETETVLARRSNP